MMSNDVTVSPARPCHGVTYVLYVLYLLQDVAATLVRERRAEGVEHRDILPEADNRDLTHLQPATSWRDGMHWRQNQADVIAMASLRTGRAPC
jgi:hypothetical protein